MKNDGVGGRLKNRSIFYKNDSKGSRYFGVFVVGCEMAIGKRQQQHHLLLKMIHIHHPIKKMPDATSPKQNQPPRNQPLARFLHPSQK